MQLLAIFMGYLGPDSYISGTYTPNSYGIPLCVNMVVVLCSVHVVVATIPDCGEYQQVGAIQIN